MLNDLCPNTSSGPLDCLLKDSADLPQLLPAVPLEYAPEGRLDPVFSGTPRGSPFFVSYSIMCALKPRSLSSSTRSHVSPHDLVLPHARMIARVTMAARCWLLDRAQALSSFSISLSVRYRVLPLGDLGNSISSTRSR